MRPITPDAGVPVVVLYSGGVDSMACAMLAARHGVLAGLLYVEYGQPAEAEERRAAIASAARYFPTVRLKTSRVSLALGAMSTATGPAIVPARNAVLLSLAASYAVELNAKTVYIGCNATDHDAYPDCRREFVWSMMESLSRACGVTCRAPFGDLDKRQIVQLVQEWGASLSDVWACYAPVDGKPCGRCHACRELLEAT